MDHVNAETASGGSHESFISPDLYKAAAMGNIEPFREINNDLLKVLATPIKNTILHIYVASPNQNKKTRFVEQIHEICPSLLRKANGRGDTPLHLAAKFGHLDIVKVLIEARRKDVESDLEAEEVKLQMLSERNTLGNTALHEAVKNSYPDVLELLTIKNVDYPGNNAGESPLFIATEIGSLEMVNMILQNCQTASHEGPDGKTALHAAVIRKNLDITRTILATESNLTKVKDSNGWTPLHYAAYYGQFSIVKCLLERNGCVAFEADNDRQMTPLHLAAGQGYVNIMEEIISCRPDCCEMVDVRGWNFLHFALASGLHHYGLFVFLRRNSKFKNLIQDLITTKDIEGNTPLHVYAACQPYFVRRLIYETKYKVRETLNKENDSIFVTCVFGSPELQKEIDELRVVSKGPYRKGIIRSDNERWRSDFNKRMAKGRDAQLVVAALVATVTFAAALTTPGGFNQEKGTSVLREKPAFQVFIITDAMAMVFSLLAVFLHLIIAIDSNLWSHLFKYSIFSTVLAVLAMPIAFVTGTYAVLTPSLGLAVGNTFIGLSFFVLFAGALVLTIRRLYR